jgi:hypothetical protein
VNDTAMPRIALYTFGLLKAAFGSERLSSFLEAAPSVFEAADAADGFIARAQLTQPDRAGLALGADYGPWGALVVPRFYRGSTKPGEVAVSATLSLWRDPQAARAFSYGALHRDAMRRRTDWFETTDFASYVLWWVAADRVPSWADAAARLEALTDDGPTPSAFNFTTQFDVLGRPVGRETGKTAS